MARGDQNRYSLLQIALMDDIELMTQSQSFRAYLVKEYSSELKTTNSLSQVFKYALFSGYLQHFHITRQF